MRREREIRLQHRWNLGTDLGDKVDVEILHERLGGLAGPHYFTVLRLKLDKLVHNLDAEKRCSTNGSTLRFVKRGTNNLRTDGTVIHRIAE